MPKLLTLKMLMSYTSMSQNTARRLAKEAGAEIHFGYSVRYDREKIDAFIESLEPKEEGVAV